MDNTTKLHILKKGATTPSPVNINTATTFLYIEELEDIYIFHKFYLEQGSMLSRYRQVFKVWDDNLFKNHQDKGNKNWLGPSQDFHSTLIIWYVEKTIPTL